MCEAIPPFPSHLHNVVINYTQEQNYLDFYSLSNMQTEAPAEISIFQCMLKNTDAKTCLLRKTG
jgi:hypothetical protein